MTAFLALGLVLIAGSACAESSSRIVGGEITSIEQYSSMVQVEYYFTAQQNWQQTCAASILNSRYVLSAAHCFDRYLPELRRIRAGTSYRHVGGVVIYVEQEFNHPDYNEYTIDSDISVVRLQSALIFSDVIRPVTIVAPGFNMPANLPVVHAGWGLTEYNVPSEVLRHVTIYTLSNEACNELHADQYLNITPNMICAAYPGGGRDACSRDSGGPLYYDNILVGIISWGIGCGDPRYASVSAAVSPFTNWIVATAV